MSGLDLAHMLVLALIVYRLTRLLCRDLFPPVRAIRVWLAGDDEHRKGGHAPEWVGDLISCHWCASFWVAGGVVYGAEATLINLVLPPLLVWGALWAVAAWPIEIEDRLRGDS